MKQETTYSYWLVLLLGGGLAFTFTDMLADHVLPRARVAAMILHLALFFPIFLVVNQVALRFRRNGNKRG